jgi:ribose/xylose/arabinose/galactoside ABC-type transport system permease subunit
MDACDRRAGDFDFTRAGDEKFVRRTIHLRRRFGRGGRATGGNPSATHDIFRFVFIGALVGLAAMMNAVQSPQVDPQSGTGLELKVIAAVVVGGVAISGGRGNLWGVFAGLLLLACVSPALTHLHVEAYWEKAIQGAIILLAVVADGLRSRKQRN